MLRRLAAAVLLAGLMTTAGAASAADCWTTQGGNYRCDFEQFGGDGSFTISAPGTATYTIQLFDDGAADGFSRIGGRNVPLPGPFFRSRDDRACWVSRETGFTICVY